MKRWWVWLLLGYLCLLLQVTGLPLILPGWAVPDLLLILVVAFGLIESLLPGVVLVCLLGCLRDVFSLTTLGLFGFITPILYVLIRLFSGQLNYDSPLLFPALVGIGSLVQGGLILLGLLSLADADSYWPLVLADLPRAACVNALVALAAAGKVMRLARGRRPYEA